MSQKNETSILVLALIITAAFLGGGYWLFARNLGVNLGGKSGSQTNNPTSTNTSSQGQAGKDFAAVQNVPNGLFNYGGSTSWAPIRLAVDPAIQAARPEFRLRYVQPSSGSPSSSTGIQGLIQGNLAFAQSSRPISQPEITLARQRGLGLEQIPVAIDGVAVAVNPNLNIPGLTLDQLKSIYTGKVTNWSQLGGANVPIKAYSRPVAEGSAFGEYVLGGQSLGSNVELVGTTTEGLKKVSSSPGGIYYASAPEVIPQCAVKPIPIGRDAGQFVPPYREPLVPASQCPSQRNQLNTEAFQSGKYPITRQLFVVVKQNGQAEEQAGKAYANFLLTQRGQELIQQTGFVKIR